jgi:hypothetical protein
MEMRVESQTKNSCLRRLEFMPRNLDKKLFKNSISALNTTRRTKKKRTQSKVTVAKETSDSINILAGGGDR